MLTILMNVQFKKAQNNYNKCVYEQDTAQRQLSTIKERMDAVETAAAANGTDCSKSASYKELAAIQSAYDTKIEKLNTQIEYYKNEMTSYKNAYKEGVKQTTSWRCLG